MQRAKANGRGGVCGGRRKAEKRRCKVCMYVCMCMKVGTQIPSTPFCLLKLHPRFPGLITSITYLPTLLLLPLFLFLFAVASASAVAATFLSAILNRFYPLSPRSYLPHRTGSQDKSIFVLADGDAQNLSYLTTRLVGLRNDPPILINQLQSFY
jgi:hypothetical protein